MFSLLLAISTILAYQPAWNAGFIWDDDDYVVNNELLTADDGLKRIWFSRDQPSQYFPLTYSTFRLERKLWGLNASGYHWVNILLHVANALLVWRALHRLRVPGAWLAAALFALHPVHVESVAWITERKNVLSLFFFLIAILAWIRFTGADQGKHALTYGTALLAYALALFSKTTACTLPAALVLILWFQNKPITPRRWLQIAPFVLMGLAMGLLAIWWERVHQGTQGEPFAIGLVERVLIASRASWFYLAKLLLPANLVFSYPRWTIEANDPADYLWLMLLLLAVATVWYLRRWFGRGPESALVFFLATLSPMLGFVMLYTFIWSFVADHYQYVASIGPLALLAAIITRGLGRRTPGLRVACGLLCTTILVSLAVLTWRQSRMYANIEILWRTTLARNPSSWLASYNLGTTLGQQGRIDEAVTFLRRTVELRPQLAGAHYNLGTLLLHRGEIDEAAEHLLKTLELEPDHALAFYKLGTALAQRGHVDAAIAHHRRALEIYPASVDAHRSLGVILLQTGDASNAIIHFDAALRLQPTAAHHVFLGNALMQANRIDEAITQFQRAILLAPDPVAHNNLGKGLLQQGHFRQAASHFELALAMDPRNLLALNNLAWVLATSPEDSLRNGSRAVVLAQQADVLSSGQNVIVCATLGAAYAESGRFSDAISAARRAKDLAQAQNNPALAEAMSAQMALYETGVPLRVIAVTSEAGSSP